MLKTYLTTATYMPARIRRSSCDTSHDLSRYAGVYEIVNKVNGDRYVGSSKCIKDRWNAHVHTLNNGRNKGESILLRAWRKYGADAFDFRVLLVCDAARTTYYEQRFIDALQPYYNIAPTAGSVTGLKFSPEVNAKKWARHRTHEVDCVLGSIKELAVRYGHVSGAVAAMRVNKGWTVEDAVKTPAMPKTECGKKSALVRKTKPSTAKVHTVQGVAGSLKYLVEHFGVTTYQRARVQVLRGWSVEEAVLSPPDGSSKLKKYTVRGEVLTLPEITAKYGIKDSVFRSRLANGWDMERSISAPKDQGAARRGQKFSDETRAKMSAAAKAYRASQRQKAEQRA
jgi:group I intron endonuclease